MPQLHKLLLFPRPFLLISSSFCPFGKPVTHTLACITPQPTASFIPVPSPRVPVKRQCRPSLSAVLEDHCPFFPASLGSLQSGILSVPQVANVLWPFPTGFPWSCSASLPMSLGFCLPLQDPTAFPPGCLRNPAKPARWAGKRLCLTSMRPRVWIPTSVGWAGWPTWESSLISHRKRVPPEQAG